jgi:alpha-glucosidase
MVFMGDEIGAEGMWGELSRTTMPWENLPTHQPETQAAYKSLLNLRRNSSALSSGGLRWLSISQESVLFLRESVSETLVFAIARSTTSATFEMARIPQGDWQVVYGNATLNPTENIVTFSVPGTTVWRIS